jgi:hypothetical protein
MATALKALESYLLDAPAHKTSLSAYIKCPAHAFLVYLCDAHDAYAHCLRKFTKKADGSYNKDSEDSRRYIACAILGTAMGHFETYQKTLFAGLVERSGAFPAFDVDRFLKQVDQRNGEVSISPARLLAFRTLSAPVGLVLADSVGSWHSPSRVNSYFKALGFKQDLFSKAEIEDLQVLWQLRHSIVHTGAWLTVPDANKVKRLSTFADKPIVFGTMFVNAFCRRFHRIVKSANDRLHKDCVAELGPKPDAAVQAEFTAFLNVKSPKSSWL